MGPSRGFFLSQFRDHPAISYPYPGLSRDGKKFLSLSRDHPMVCIGYRHGCMQGSERNGFERCRFAFCSATLSRKRFCFPFRFSKNRCRFVPVSKPFEKNRFRFVSVPKRLKENRSHFDFRFVPERVSFRNTIQFSLYSFLFLAPLTNFFH